MKALLAGLMLLVAAPVFAGPTRTTNRITFAGYQWYAVYQSTFGTRVDCPQTKAQMDEYYATRVSTPCLRNMTLTRVGGYKNYEFNTPTGRPRPGDFTFDLVDKEGLLLVWDDEGYVLTITTRTTPILGTGDDISVSGEIIDRRDPRRKYTITNGVLERIVQ